MGVWPLWQIKSGTQKSGEQTPVAAKLEAPDTQVFYQSKEIPLPAKVVTSSPLSCKQNIVTDSTWHELAQAVANCRACPLWERRNQAVLGVGDQQPDWLFIGEGPGAEEDARGEPFVGQAGRLLNNMLAAIGLKREKGIYIANAVKCRPPGNRTPEHTEMAACRPFLEQQITLLKPRLIVLLGKAAVHTLLHEDKSLASLRQRVFEYQGIPTIVTYHPAYLLRNLPDKAKVWEDLLFARQCLEKTLKL